VTVVLHVIRSSGPPERHVLRADGDVVHLPHHFLTSDDVVGLDVEVRAGKAESGAPRDDHRDVAAFGGGTGAATPGALLGASGVSPGVSSALLGSGQWDPFFRLLDEMRWLARPADDPNEGVTASQSSERLPPSRPP
jgi:hypothetical protein